MSILDSIADEILHGYTLLNEGKVEKVLHIIDKIELENNISPEDHLNCQLLKGNLCFITSHLFRSLKIAKKIHQDSIELDKPLYAVNVMFSDEYQVEFLKKYIEVASSKDYIIGVHVWNLTDFKTGQSIRRVGAMNYKGVFTRDRRPKMAAHFLRKIWKGKL